MTMETPISHSPGGFDVIHGHDWLVGPAVNQLANMNKRVPASDSWPLHNEQPWLTSIHVFFARLTCRTRIKLNDSIYVSRSVDQ